MKASGIRVAPTTLVLFGLVASSAFAQSSYSPGGSCTASGEQRQQSAAGAARAIQRAGLQSAVPCSSTRTLYANFPTQELNDDIDLTCSPKTPPL